MTVEAQIGGDVFYQKKDLQKAATGFAHHTSTCTSTFHINHAKFCCCFFFNDGKIKETVRVETKIKLNFWKSSHGFENENFKMLLS